MGVVAELQLLRKQWAKNCSPCVICGIGKCTEKDHIPPRSLYPKSLRDPATEFLTYPVCTRCNRTTSDSDFVMAFRLAAQLNQENYKKGIPPSDPDLIELDKEITKLLTSKNQASQRKKILAPRTRGQNATLGAIDLPDKMILPTLLKMARALYWLKTDGDVLESHKPTWWVRSGLDTSTSNFAKHILSKTNVSIEWSNRFVTRYNIAGPESAIPGALMAAFIFYSNREAGAGYTWFVLCVPSKYEIDGEVMRKSVERTWGRASAQYSPLSKRSRSQ